MRLTNVKAIKPLAVLHDNEIRIAKRKGVEFLSPPFRYPISKDSYHKYVTTEHFWIRWRFNAIREILPKEWSSRPALEVGCGCGITGELIQSYYGCPISGCDLDLSPLCIYHSTSPRYFYNIHDRRKEWNNFFSNVFLLDVLEHIENPVSFLESINFHLKIEGLLIINVPAFQFLYSQYDAVQGHFKRYTIPSIKKELHLAGFHLERASYWGMSMLPIIFLRKLMMPFFRKDKAVKIGFEPSFTFINNFLKALMKIECAFIPQPPVGSSLLIVARKNK